MKEKAKRKEREEGGGAKVKNVSYKVFREGKCETERKHSGGQRVLLTK